MRFCSLASGSSGNCQYVGSKKAGILIDAGVTGKYILNSLARIDTDPATVKGVLVTHEHADHIKGAGIIAGKLKIPIIGTHETISAVREKISLEKVETIIIEKNTTYTLDGGIKDMDDGDGDIYFTCSSSSHDAVDPVNVSIDCKNSRISIVTDTGAVSGDVARLIESSDYIVLEANHDVEMLKVGPYPFYLKKRILSEQGHLSNDDAALISTNAVEKGRVKGILLAHMSGENNFPELAYQTVATKLRERGIEPHVDVAIELAHRDRLTSLITLE